MTLTQLLSIATENDIVQAVVQACMIGDKAKILRALKAAIRQVEANE